MKFFKDILTDVQSEDVYKQSSRPIDRSVCKAFSQAYELKVVYRQSYRPTKSSVCKGFLTRVHREGCVWRLFLWACEENVL